MTERLFSPHWYRVASLRPRLQTHLVLRRHIYRGEPWYVVDDPAQGRQHRFNRPLYHMLSLMDGRRPLTAIWQRLGEVYGDEAPSQDQMIALLARLYRGQLIRTDVAPEVGELLARRQRARGGAWRRALGNPLAVRFPLFDPNRSLARLLPAVSWLFTLPAALAWLLLTGFAAVTALANLDAIALAVGTEALQAHNLVVLAVLYPLVKLAHELGHGLTVRHFGGEVHETGILLLVLMPLPYVDASGAAAFRQRSRRIAVAAAGIVVELTAASLGLFLWLATEPGLLHSIGFNLMLIGGLASLLFNANPLVRFDGYFIAADLLDIPNLATRSRAYAAYLVQRHVLRCDSCVSPVTATGERPWLLGYAIASSLYRLILLLAIALWLADHFFFVGTALALWAVAQQLVLPMFRTVSRTFTDRRARPGALAACLFAAGLLVALLCWAPFPYRSIAEGVVWPPEESGVRAAHSGFVQSRLAAAHSVVSEGQPLFILADEELAWEQRHLALRLSELQLRRDSVWSADRVEANVLQDEIETVTADLARLEERLADLTVRSPLNGVFVPTETELEGGFVRQGQLLGYVTAAGEQTAQVLVTQADIGAIEAGTEAIRVRLASARGGSMPARLRRQTPQGSQHLPSRVLAVTGGGSIAVDPDDPEGLRTLERLFRLELAFPGDGLHQHLGERVYVRFDHGRLPLATQWYRSLRRAFLGRFDA